MIYKGIAGILRRSVADLQPCLHTQAGFPAQRNGGVPMSCRGFRDSSAHRPQVGYRRGTLALRMFW